MAESENESVQLATNLTLAWLGNPNVRASSEDATTFLQNIYTALNNLSGNENGSSEDGTQTTTSTGQFTPAVSARKSLASRDKIISMIDGKPYSTLKRHLSRHGLTPEQYRERFGLKPDYPMVAPAYSETRISLAKTIGLGNKGGRKPAATKTEASPAKASIGGRRKTLKIAAGA